MFIYAKVVKLYLIISTETKNSMTCCSFLSIFGYFCSGLELRKII